MSDIKRGFTGWFIPVELIDDYHLSFQEAALWAEIKALSVRAERCTAGAEHFATHLGISERHVKRMIAHLREVGLVQDVAFDGRTKTIMALQPGHGCHGRGDKNVIPAVTKMSPLNSPPYISEIEDEREGEDNTCPQGGRGMAAAAEDIAEPEPPDDSPSEQLPSPPPPVPRPPSKRPVNPVFDAVAEAWGVSSAQTKASGSDIGKTVSEIRAIYPGMSNEDLAAEVRRRAQNYRLKYPGCELTPSALRKHWPALNVATPARPSSPLAADDRQYLIRENIKAKILR